MSNPTTAEALHDLRAAQALIDRALATLEGKPAPVREKPRKPARFFGDQPAPKG